MTTRAVGIALTCFALVSLAGCATTPPEQDPVQIKLKDLDARLTRIERVVDNGSLLDLANEVEAMRADLRSLHNSVSQLDNELDSIRKQQRDLYADLDKRLKKIETGGRPPGGPAAPGAAAGAAPGAAQPDQSAGAGGAPGGTPADGGNDQAHYEAGFALLKDSQYDKAIAAFEAFLATYPDSEYADNAQYWLGEAYYVERNFPQALQAFQGVVDKYAQSRKLPDALLKIGYCDYELKRVDQAKQVLTEVVARFPDTPAGRLAVQRLQKIEAEQH